MKEFSTPPGMTAETALELVERLVYDHSGTYLNDLERQVFLGSWQGQTYEEIRLVRNINRGKKRW